MKTLKQEHETDRKLHVDRSIIKEMFTQKNMRRVKMRLLMKIIQTQKM